MGKNIRPGKPSEKIYDPEYVLMGYEVREANLDTDQEIMVDILANNRSVADFDYNKRFSWIYKENPTGEARAWIIWDDKKNIPVGFTGVFPRVVYVQGKAMIVWNCGDFSIEKKYRVLGIALKLRKAAKNAVNNGEIPFLYAHPNERMELIHLRSGHKKIARMKRFALPIRANRIVMRYIKSNFLARWLSKPVNLALSMKYRFSTFLGLSGELHNHVHVGEKHQQVFDRMVNAFPIVGDRSVGYIKWKFANNPNRVYQQFDMYYKHNLVGTVFFTRKEDVVYIIDVLIDDFDRFAGQLFRMFINTVRPAFKRQIVSFSFILQEYNPFIPVLKQLGFKFRDDATSAVIAYVNEESNPKLAKTVYDGHNWFMTVGDRDA